MKQAYTGVSSCLTSPLEGEVAAQRRVGGVASQLKRIAASPPLLSAPPPGGEAPPTSPSRGEVKASRARFAMMWAALFAFAVIAPLHAQPPVPKAVELVMEDQFERKTDLADLRGNVVVLVFGDRKGNDACRTLGEQLHVCWHPGAKGQPPAKAQAAPVVPLDGLKPGQVAPNVIVVPVACCGKVPAAIRPAIGKQIAKGSPDVVVWLDYADAMKGQFGLTAGETNVVVIDAAGRARVKFNGVIDQPAMDNLVKTVQGLRAEAAR